VGCFSGILRCFRPWQIVLDVPWADRPSSSGSGLARSLVESSQIDSPPFLSRSIVPDAGKVLKLPVLLPWGKLYSLEILEWDVSVGFLGRDLVLVCGECWWSRKALVVRLRLKSVLHGRLLWRGHQGRHCLLLLVPLASRHGILEGRSWGWRRRGRDNLLWRCRNRRLCVDHQSRGDQRGRCLQLLCVDDMWGRLLCRRQ
jgi:hypothetical protein